MAHKESDWRFAEEFVTERDEVVAARSQSVELGIDAVSPATAAQIALVAAAANASQIIEIGTGVGVSGLCLLRAAPDSVLTSIDVEVEHQQEARKRFLEAGVAANRIRLISGRALDVLPRMNEGSYDIVLIDADPGKIIEYAEHGIRLARTGGTVLITHALWRGRVSDPAQRDEITVGFRTLLREVGGSDAVTSALSPVGDGLLQLTKRGN